MSAGVHQTAALAIYSLKQYGRDVDKADTDKVLARAAAWLESAKPVTTQDRAFHLLGLGWANASAASIATASKALASDRTCQCGLGRPPW